MKVKLQTKLMILGGNLLPVLVGAVSIPNALTQVPAGASAEKMFATVMLAALPALVAAAVGALLALVGGITLLIDTRSAAAPMPLANKVWLGFSAVLPLAFAVLFLVGVVKQSL